MTITCQPATVHTHTRHKATSWAPRKKRVQRPRCSTATGQRGSGAPPPPGGPWSPASPQGHSPGSSAHSPSHSHKIPCLPSRCASAPPGVSWGTCGAGPSSARLPACNRNEGIERRRNSLPWLPARHLLRAWANLVLSLRSHSTPTSAPHPNYRELNRSSRQFLTFRV